MCQICVKGVSFKQCIYNETVGVKSADLPVRHAWVSQIVLFDMPKHVNLTKLFFCALGALVNLVRMMFADMWGKTFP